jgi:hypothetical protein
MTLPSLFYTTSWKETNSPPRRVVSKPGIACASQSVKYWSTGRTGPWTGPWTGLLTSPVWVGGPVVRTFQ